MTTLPTKNLTLARIPRNPNLILAEVSEIAPAARDKDQNNWHKNQKKNQNDNRIYRQFHARSLSCFV
jgi:hypothetical protein